MKDMHSKIKVVRAIDPAAIGTTGIAGGKLSGVIDRRGYHSAEFLLALGLVGASGDTTNVIVYECATSGGTFTSVADADLIGTEAAAGRGAVALTSGSGINLATRIGYRGTKRFLKIRLYGLGHATGLVAATCILGDPDIAPVA